MRKLSLFLCFVMLLALLPVTALAAGNKGGWMELLEVTSVNPDGTNGIAVDSTSKEFILPLPTEMRLCKIDMVLTHASSASLTSAKVTFGNSTSSLSVIKVDSYTTRLYGNIPAGYYQSIHIILSKSNSTYYKYNIVSCKVSSLSTSDVPATGTLKRSFSDTRPLTLPNNFSVASDGSTNSYEYKLIPVTITDWRKFDYVTLYGSISSMALSSFRATIGNKGLPYEISYMEAVPTGSESAGGLSYKYISWAETNYYTAPENPDEGTREEGTAAGDTWENSTVCYGGSILYTITIDLTGVDRTISGNLDCFFTCIANPGIGYAFNVQNASGCIVTADTSSVSWWSRFTTFMTDLFGGDTSQADEFADEMEQTNQELQDANEQLESVTRPAVEDVPLDPSEFLDAGGMFYTGQIFQRLLGNDLVLPMASITLICALAAFIIF